ncbi:MAG: acyltransferase [Chloroflexi bacterium]|nr:acyltransferase [Chloroflexota bacterium]
MPPTLALVQFQPRLGDLHANLERHLDWIRRARSQGADVVVFPELSLTGYILQDLVPVVARRPRREDPIFGPLLEASRTVDVVVGFVEEDQRSRFFNSAAYLSQGQVVHVHRKVYLPTYGMFDEGRFFAWGDHVAAFDTRFGRFGLLICEDFWHVSPPYLLWLDGADVMIFPMASPGRGIVPAAPKLSTARWVEAVVQAYAGLFTVFTAFVNRTGFEDGIHFWGGSAIYGPDGSLLAQAPYSQEALLLQELDLRALHRARARLPLLRDERTALFQRELARILERRELPKAPPRF